MSHQMTRPVWQTLWLGLVVLVASLSALAQQRVAVCHYPPGNPANFHILQVAPKAVAAHIAHGDNLVDPEDADSPGTCTDGIDNNCDGLIDSAHPKCTPSCHPTGTFGCTSENFVTFCCTGPGGGAACSGLGEGGPPFIGTCQAL